MIYILTVFFWIPLNSLIFYFTSLTFPELNTMTILANMLTCWGSLFLSIIILTYYFKGKEFIKMHHKKSKRFRNFIFLLFFVSIFILTNVDIFIVLNHFTLLSMEEIFAYLVLFWCCLLLCVMSLCLFRFLKT